MSPEPSWGLAVVAIMCGLAGSVSLYFTSSHQSLLARPWQGRFRHLPGALLLIASLLLLLNVQGTGTAVFSWLSLQMLVFTVLPFVGLLKKRKPGR